MDSLREWVFSVVVAVALSYFCISGLLLLVNDEFNRSLASSDIGRDWDDDVIVADPDDAVEAMG
jgi:hypothetical protein